MRKLEIRKYLKNGKSRIMDHWKELNHMPLAGERFQ